jgi:7-keto-8-aminopelargonate synthetase-like enzyme
MPTTTCRSWKRLKEAREAGARHVLIATDGVFSMDGVIANLKGVCDLADKYDALVMVDDSTPSALSAKTAAAPMNTAT